MNELQLSSSFKPHLSRTVDWAFHIPTNQRDQSTKEQKHRKGSVGVVLRWVSAKSVLCFKLLWCHETVQFSNFCLLNQPPNSSCNSTEWSYRSALALQFLGSRIWLSAICNPAITRAKSEHGSSWNNHKGISREYSGLCNMSSPTGLTMLVQHRKVPTQTRGVRMQRSSECPLCLLVHPTRIDLIPGRRCSSSFAYFVPLIACCSFS